MANNDPNIQVTLLNLSLPSETQEMILLLEGFSLDMKGAGEPLSQYTKKHLAEELRKRDGCRVFIARVDGKPAGLSICFQGFSTFACRPIMNIHDFLVATKFRGRGISKLLLAEIQSVAVRDGCCKLTLEVLENNEIAKHVYKQFGFAPCELDPNLGRALFYEKSLADEM